MKSLKWISPLVASGLAFGAVSFGSSFETEAQAANQSWDYISECSRGCSHEETDEYFRNGSYSEEVMDEAGDGNRREMMELTRLSQSWCKTMLVDMSYTREVLFIAGTSCSDPWLGWGP